MTVLVADDLRALTILADHGVYPDRANFRGVIVLTEDQTRVVGAAGIDHCDVNPQGEAINAVVHAAGRNYWSRRALRQFYGWLFNDIKLHRVTAECTAENADAQRGMKLIGYRIEGTRREAGPNREDIVMLGLLASECRLFAKERSHG